jgi:hypothetical protein
MKDTAYRTLHYVEVIYLKNGMYESRKFQHYPPDEADLVYERTLKKLAGTDAHVSLREENHQLLKCELLKFRTIDDPNNVMI